MKRKLLRFRPGPLFLYGIGALVLLLAGVYAAGYVGDWVNEARDNSVLATWAYHFSDLGDMEESADAIVLAEVVDVRSGRVAGGEASKVSFTNARIRILED